MSKVFACSYEGCDQVFNQPSKLRKHAKVVHEGPESAFHCLDCDFYTLSQRNFKIHIARHTGKMEQKCPQEGCHFETNDPSYLLRHRKTNHGYKPRPRPLRGKQRATIEFVLFDATAFDTSGSLRRLQKTLVPGPAAEQTHCTVHEGIRDYEQVVDSPLFCSDPSDSSRTGASIGPALNDGINNTAFVANQGDPCLQWNDYAYAWPQVTEGAYSNNSPPEYAMSNPPDHSMMHVDWSSESAGFGNPMVEPSLVPNTNGSPSNATATYSSYGQKQSTHLLLCGNSFTNVGGNYSGSIAPNGYYMPPNGYEDTGYMAPSQAAGPSNADWPAPDPVQDIHYMAQSHAAGPSNHADRLVTPVQEIELEIASESLGSACKCSVCLRSRSQQGYNPVPDPQTDWSE